MAHSQTWEAILQSYEDVNNLCTVAGVLVYVTLQRLGSHLDQRKVTRRLVHTYGQRKKQKQDLQTHSLLQFAHRTLVVGSRPTLHVGTCPFPLHMHGGMKSSTHCSHKLAYRREKMTCTAIWLDVGAKIMLVPRPAHCQAQSAARLRTCADQTWYVLYVMCCTLCQTQC